MIALGLLFTSGARCSQSIFSRYRPSYAPKCSYQPFRAPKLTKPHPGFMGIIRSNLALACTLNLAAKVLRHFTLSADTALPLLVEHSEADICLNTDRERLLGAFPTPPNDFKSRDLLRKLFVDKQKYSLCTTLSSCQNVRSHIKS